MPFSWLGELLGSFKRSDSLALSPEPEEPAPVSRSLSAPRVPETSPGTTRAGAPDVFRVTGIPLDTTPADLIAALSSAFSAEQITIDDTQMTLCVSPHKRTQTAVIQFQPCTPKALETMGEGYMYSIYLGTQKISIDRNFYGLTQLYATIGSDIKADIVAVCGLGGHAYGSWLAKGNHLGKQKMWLHHFLADDLPDCRTMIYGYDSTINSRPMHNFPDYSDGLLEELKRARRSDDEKERPLIFIGHSYGVLTIAQSIIKAKEDENTHGTLFSRTRAIIFFGNPRRDMIIEEILGMIGDQSDGAVLRKLLETGCMQLRQELQKFIQYSTLTSVTIINFIEIHRARTLKQECWTNLGEDGRWFKSEDGRWLMGEEYNAILAAESPVLHLPKRRQTSMNVEGNHSTMIKFDHRRDWTYPTVCRCLEDFVATGDRVSAYKAIKNQNSVDLKEAIIQHGVNLNKIYNGQGTLLHMAITNNDEKSIMILLKHGARVESVDAGGNTPLHLATRTGNKSVIDKLIESGADIEATSQGMTALHIAAKTGDRNMVEFLLDKKSNIAAISKDKQNPFTPLHYAAQAGHLLVIETLLDRGANVNCTARDGSTPLHSAAWQGQENVVRFLVTKGSNINATRRDLSTPLHLAVSQGHRMIVEELLGHGANKTARDDSGHTVLHAAAMNGYTDVVGVLLAAGIDHSWVSVNHQTALHLAAKNGKESVVELLLDGGADRTLFDKTGSTALNLAERAGHKRVVELLGTHSQALPMQLHVPNSKLLVDSSAILRIGSAGRAALSNFLQYRMKTEVHNDHIVHQEEVSAGVFQESVWDQECEIGRGGAGSVWRQKERKRGELRAVKMILKPKEGLSQELLALVELKDYHHYFVKFFGWYMETNSMVMFLAMEYLKDGDLSGYIQQHLTAKSNAKDITTQILRGLEILHSKKIYHRDIKPQNILIARLNPIWVKIADFGVSKQAIGTTVKTQWGTECYSPPEIMGAIPRGPRGIKFPAYALDIWPLGSLVHELLTSHTPFTTTTSATEEYGAESGVVGGSPSIRRTDILSLYEYCKGNIEFPTEILRGSNVNEGGIAFIKSLLAPFPQNRPTAELALQDPWLIGTRCDASC